MATNVVRRKSAGTIKPVYLNTSSAKTTRQSLIPDGTSVRPPSLGIQLENTYQMEPNEKYPHIVTRDLILETLQEYLGDKMYNKDEAPLWTNQVAEQIKAKAKSLQECDRYKIITYVAIGEKKNSSTALTSRCVWNDNFDERAEAYFSNASLYAIGIVFAIYCE